MTMGTMRAAVLEGARAISVRDVPVPEPGPGEVLLRVSRCGICGSDLSLYATGALAGPNTILGHELSAAVERDPASHWPPGTRVTVYPSDSCGRCPWCLQGEYRYCLDPPAQHGGGFAEYLTAPARSLIALPDGIDDRAAALTEPLGVALRGVQLAGAARGDLAYVSGLGAIGLLTVAGLVDAGCRVIGGDPRRERRELALRAGCEAAIDPTVEDPAAATAAFDPRGPHLAFECSGAPASLQQVFETCGPGGVVGILGIPVAPVSLLRMTLRELRAFSIQGPSMASMRRALDLLRRRELTSLLITGTVSLDELPAAFDTLAGGSGGVKVLVRPGS